MRCISIACEKWFQKRSFLVSAKLLNSWKNASSNTLDRKLTIVGALFWLWVWMLHFCSSFACVSNMHVYYVLIFLPCSVCIFVLYTLNTFVLESLCFIQRLSFLGSVFNVQVLIAVNVIHSYNSNVSIMLFFVRKPFFHLHSVAIKVHLQHFYNSAVDRSTLDNICFVHR